MRGEKQEGVKTRLEHSRVEFSALLFLIPLLRHYIRLFFRYSISKTGPYSSAGFSSFLRTSVPLPSRLPSPHTGSISGYSLTSNAHAPRAHAHASAHVVSDPGGACERRPGASKIVRKREAKRETEACELDSLSLESPVTVASSSSPSSLASRSSIILSQRLDLILLARERTCSLH